jgi:sortase A
VASSTLWIPSLGIEAPVVEPASADERAYQEALRDGVVHFPGTAAPGEPGNVYLFGHSSDYVWAKGRFKTVFALLTSIEAGDLVTLSDAAGRPFRYRVTGTKVVAPDDLSVLDQGDGSRRLLTLQTSYPLGTALRRFIVLAELVE